jgi:hypothetical protein
MMRRYSKAKAVASDASAGGGSTMKGGDPAAAAPGTMSFSHMYEKRVAEMAKVRVCECV